jgi:pimeloyl-ACP methyl ester carboxylesterase
VERHEFTHNGMRFSYLDAGGDAQVLIALHAHWMEGATFAPVADALAPAWRVIAPDQRGHGYSNHAATYSRDDYVGDLETLFELLAIDRAVLLGNSLGGINAIQFAARHPEKVRGLIVEDIAAVVQPVDMSFVLKWGGVFATREALERAIGERFVPALTDSFREVSGGWKLAFEPAEMIASQKNLEGAYWDDWVASSCPALVLRGRESRVTNEDVVLEMATRRKNTQAMTLPGSHVLHQDDFPRFLTVVKLFLQTLPR